MTDLEKFIELYKSFGIECTPFDTSFDPNGIIHIVLGKKLRYHEKEVRMTISDKINGYCGFYSEIIFNKDGKFLSQGFWE